MNTQAVNEVIGLSQKWNQTTSVVWTRHLEFLDGGWMSPPACLGRELTVTLGVKEGAREVEREAGRQGVKDWMRKKRVWEKEWGQMLSQWLTLVVTKSQIAQKNKGISVHSHQHEQVISGVCMSSGRDYNKTWSNYRSWSNRTEQYIRIIQGGEKKEGAGSILILFSCLGALCYLGGVLRSLLLHLAACSHIFPLFVLIIPEPFLHMGDRSQWQKFCSATTNERNMFLAFKPATY